MHAHEGVAHALQRFCGPTSGRLAPRLELRPPRRSQCARCDRLSWDIGSRTRLTGPLHFSDLAQYLPLETSRSTRASLQLLAEGPFCQALLRDGRSMHLLDRDGLGLPVIVTWFLLADACLLASVTRSAAAVPLPFSVCNKFVRIVRIMRSSIITQYLI